jgi:hypothetical protein
MAINSPAVSRSRIWWSVLTAPLTASIFVENGTKVTEDTAAVPLIANGSSWERGLKVGEARRSAPGSNNDSVALIQAGSVRYRVSDRRLHH